MIVAGLGLGSWNLYEYFKYEKQNVESKQHAECIKILNKQGRLEQEALKNFNPDFAKKLYEEGQLKQAIEEALSPFMPLIEITNHTEQCGIYEKGFYKEEADMCRLVTFNSDFAELIDSLKQETNLISRETSYCDSAFKREDSGSLPFGFFLSFVKGDFVEKDYKKAIEYLDIAVKKGHEYADAMFYAVPVYRQGGHGIKKDEAKAFEILKSLTSEENESDVPCELSLYYKNGIGTPKDEAKAAEWLAVYKKHNPDKECEFADFGFLFRSSRLLDEIYKEDSEKAQ